MLVILLHTLYESVHRRMGLVLLLVSLLACGLQLWFIRFQAQPGGKVLVHAGSSLHQPDIFFRSHWSMLLAMTSGLWLFMAIFACASLLTTFLEKGWADILFSKGISRWRVLTGRYLAGLALFAVMVVFLDVLPALYFGLRTGIAPWRFLAAVGFHTFNFAVVLALMAVAGVATANSGVPILAAFLQVFLSEVLFSGKRDLLAYFTSQWAREAIEWSYRILPKIPEVRQMASAYVQSGTVASWWPVWSSALFLAGALAAAYVVLHRKDF